MALMHPDVLSLRNRLRDDLPFWARTCATILNDQRQPVKLVARPWQARTPETPAHMTPIDEAIEAQRAAGLPMRILILKSRKLGCSTWIQARLMQRATQNPFQFALTIAHLRSSASYLADMAQLMYDRLPDDLELARLIYGPGTTQAPPFSIRPQLLGKGTTREGTRWMQLGRRGRASEASVYSTMTAGSKAGGRGGTPSDVHVSEAAHIEDEQFLVGLLNSVPLLPGTFIAIESTAKGYNAFHDRWQRAVEGAEDEESGGVYTPLFYGWQDNPENTLPFVSDQARDRFERTIGDTDGGGDPEEIELIERFGVTFEQLWWRRQVIETQCNGDIEIFHQEQCATPEQAFIGSGRPVFPGILVARMISEAQRAPAPVEGVLRGVEHRERRTRHGTVRVPQGAIWVPGASLSGEDEAQWAGSRLLVWEHPVNAGTQEGLPAEEIRPDGQYVAFMDVAIGQGNTVGTDPDWHAIQVLDHISRLQVARWRSRLPLHDAPMIAFLIGLYFNRAWLAPEVNGPGIAVVDVLRAELHYPRLYRRSRAGDDDRTDQREHLRGWQTDTRTKPLMEQTFGAVLKEGVHGCRDVATAREATTYVSDPKNAAKHGAGPGSHDDLLMAFMGAHRVAAELRPQVPGERAGRVRSRRVD